MLCLNNVVFINLVLLCGDIVKNLGPEAWLNNNLSIVPLGGGGGVFLCLKCGQRGGL